MTAARRKRIAYGAITWAIRRTLAASSTLKPVKSGISTTRESRETAIAA